MDPLVTVIALLAGAAVAALVAQVYIQATFARRLIHGRVLGESGSGLTFAPSSILRQSRNRFPVLAMLPLSPEAQVRMSHEIMRAGWRLRVGEYLGIRLLCAVGGTAVGILLLARFGLSEVPIRAGGILVGAFAGWLIPRFFLSHARDQRLQKIEEQLPDALTSIAKSLRAGSGVLQALAYAARETPAPLGPELQSVLRELELGGEAETVFAALADRVGSPDLDIAVTAIVIQRTIGGNLAEILTNVTNTIRSRALLHREVRVITTRQRVTSNMVAAVPVVISILIIVVNPKMSNMLFESVPGRIALGIGVAFELLGIYLIRRFAKIDV